MPSRVIVSIINYRTAGLTIECIRSALADIGTLNAEVVVIDNASGDGSADCIADWIGRQPEGTPVRLIRSATNSGFSGGHNQVFRAAPADYYLLLNSDALVRPGLLETLLHKAEADPAVGIVSPQIIDGAGTPQVSCFRFHRPLSEFIRAAHSAPVTRALKAWDVPMPHPVDPEQIEWVSFACVLISRAMIDAIGEMDEGYFLYFEDTEYCLRAQKAGFRILSEPAATVLHYQGGSGPVTELERTRRRLPRYYYASRTRFFVQAHGRIGLIAANALWYVGRSLAILRPLLGKRLVPPVEAEARDLWINAFTPLEQR